MTKVFVAFQAEDERAPEEFVAVSESGIGLLEAVDEYEADLTEANLEVDPNEVERRRDQAHRVRSSIQQFLRWHGEHGSPVGVFNEWIWRPADRSKTWPPLVIIYLPTRP